MRQKLINLEAKFWEGRRSNTNPSIFQHDYLMHLTLYQDLKHGFSEVREKSKRDKLKIVDIGCGDRPYLKLAQNWAKVYIGVDLNQEADVVALAENLPFPDASFDLALCFQVLEHTDNPQKAVQEMKRIVKKGGFVLASTHGVWNHHPFPHDYHRWTHEGLEKLFEAFSEVKVKPNLNSYSSVIQIINIELYILACSNILIKLPLYGLITLLNLIGRAATPNGQKHLSVNYLVLARV